MTILSILIPTIPERYEMFVRLFNKLSEQITYCETFHSTLGGVEILFDDSVKFLDGGLSIGKKRESLVSRAGGRYLAFLDDDEDISPNYLETLVRLCNQELDICTFRAIAKLDTYWAVIDMSLKNGSDMEATPTATVTRMPWHVCPVRTEFAKRYEFKDVSYGEDAEWMSKVLKDCKDEAHTEAVILQYNHSSKTSEADRIVKGIEMIPDRYFNGKL